MWQRIQTVFLVIAIISLVATIFLPIWGNKGAEETIYELYPLHFSITKAGAKTTNYFPYCLTAVLAVASITISAISIRRFDNRFLQMKLGVLNSFILVGVIASAVLMANGLIKTYGQGQYGFGLYAPGIAVICNLLANRFIRRDEKLVRDSQRLR